MDADMKRDLVRKTILTEIKNGSTRYTDIKDVVIVKCKDLASSNTVKKQFYKYLIPQGYVERVKRGKYRLSEKGEKLLAVFTQNSH